MRKLVVVPLLVAALLSGCAHNIAKIDPTMRPEYQSSGLVLSGSPAIQKQGIEPVLPPPPPIEALSVGGVSAVEQQVAPPSGSFLSKIGERAKRVRAVQQHTIVTAVTTATHKQQSPSTKVQAAPHVQRLVKAATVAKTVTYHWLKVVLTIVIAIIFLIAFFSSATSKKLPIV